VAYFLKKDAYSDFSRLKVLKKGIIPGLGPIGLYLNKLVAKNFVIILGDYGKGDKKSVKFYTSTYLVA